MLILKLFSKFGCGLEGGFEGLEVLEVFECRFEFGWWFEYRHEGRIIFESTFELYGPYVQGAFSSLCRLCVIWMFWIASISASASSELTNN